MTPSAPLRRATITATGRFFPSRRLDNRHFYETLGLDTSEEWIRTRTGIRERRVVDPEAGETTATMATQAARACLARRDMDADELDCILLATVTPDLGYPASANLVQEAIGASRAWVYDVQAACSGFLYSLTTASMMVESGRCDRVLVIGADCMSRILDYTDRATCTLFGDGAGAVLVEAVPEGLGGGFLDWEMAADGSGVPHLYRTGGGIQHEYPDAVSLTKHERVYQEGSVVFRQAVTRIAQVVRTVLERNELPPDQVDLFVPHQANIRIIEAARAKVQVPVERVVVTIDRHANTTSATIPTALDVAIEDGRVAQGDNVLLCAFGGGFTWGASLLRWSLPMGDE
jgi:3-oxoacyl-[acyl-carrier-protein] synthase III